MLPETIARLADLEQVVGVKEACGDLDQISEVIDALPGRLRVLSGDDALTLPILAIGGKGVISTTANVAPAEMVALVRVVPRRRRRHARAAATCACCRSSTRCSARPTRSR